MKPNILNQYLNPLYVQKYERYLPSAFDEGLTLLEKTNKVIIYLNQIGELSNNVLDEWNTVMDWLMNDGLVGTIDEEIQSMVDDGTLAALINESIFTFDGLGIIDVYVNATTGNDANSGKTSDSPFRTIGKVIDYLQNLTEAALTKQVEVHLSGTFTDGVKINYLPRFHKPLKFTGDVLTDGTPNTIIDFNLGTKANKIGFWVEPAMDLNMEIRNLYFKNFKSSGTGYGIIMKKHGFLYAENCIADNCDTGFGLVDNCIFDIRSCTAQNCTTGFSAQYSSSGNFGYQSGTGYQCQAINCFDGFQITRNAVVHIDYCHIEGSTGAGLRMNTGSPRANVNHTEFVNNAIGVDASSNAEWINDTSSFTNNTINYQHSGNAMETRLYGLGKQSEYRLGYNFTETTVTGSTDEVIVYSGSALGKLPEDFFKENTKRLRVVVYGEAIGSAGVKTIYLRSTDSNGSHSAVIGGNSFGFNVGQFVAEFIVAPKTATSQFSCSKVTFNDTTSKVYYQDRPMDATFERWFRLTTQLGVATDSLVIKGMEVYLMG